MVLIGCQWSVLCPFHDTHYFPLCTVHEFKKAVGRCISPRLSIDYSICRTMAGSIGTRHMEPCSIIPPCFLCQTVFPRNSRTYPRVSARFSWPYLSIIDRLLGLNYYITHHAMFTVHCRRSGDIKYISFITELYFEPYSIALYLAQAPSKVRSHSSPFIRALTLHLSYHKIQVRKYVMRDFHHSTESRRHGNIFRTFSHILVVCISNSAKNCLPILFMIDLTYALKYDWSPPSHL